MQKCRGICIWIEASAACIGIAFADLLGPLKTQGYRNQKTKEKGIEFQGYNWNTFKRVSVKTWFNIGIKNVRFIKFEGLVYSWSTWTR